MLVVWILLALLLLVAVHDVFQKKHAILRNFPVIGHLRYLLEMVGPELRQYIVTSNNEERPFSRDERTWVYASSKLQNNYFGFGTDNELELSPNYLILKQSTFPYPHRDAEDPLWRLPVAKVIGGPRGRAKAFRPSSVVSVSAMSFGSLSSAAVEALNRGCAQAEALQNTGEGGVSPHHRHGGELIYQIGTGYFGCRDEQGRFSMERCLETVASAPVRAIEIKLSQGAKPGKGGLLPQAKISPEIARIRGIPMDRDCISPPSHGAFHDTDSMLDFVERLAGETGLPVGIKAAVGQDDFWVELARLMERGDRGVDFITIDGGEGGTGAAPLVFSDHVSLPFKRGFSRVFKIFADRGLHERVVFCGAGKLGFPETGLFAMALGCDMIGVAREAMLSIGCIQAQRCHTDHCPTGVTTQNRWLMRGLDPLSKSARCANYLVALRRELTWLSHACGVCHPALITSDHFEVLDGRLGSRSLEELYDYDPSWGRPGAEDRATIESIMREAGATA